MMKPNLVLQERMRKLYHRFQQSTLTRAAFCREEGISAAQFIYWCRFFEKESAATPVSLTLAQVSTPIQVIKESEASKPFSPETSSSFTQLHLPEPAAATPTSVISSAVSTTPLMVLDIAGKGRLEFYSPVEASFLKDLLS
jgi:hypothetical protein